MKTSILMCIITLTLALMVIVVAKTHKKDFQNESPQQQNESEKWQSWDEIEPKPVVEKPSKIEINPDPPRRLPNNYREALGYTKTKNGKMLLVFSSNSCDPCQAMKNNTYSNPMVQQALIDSKIVLVYHINSKERDIKRQYGVTAIPAYYIVDGDQKVYKSGLGYKGPTEFINWIKN